MGWRAARSQNFCSRSALRDIDFSLRLLSLSIRITQANTKMPHKKLISMTRTDDLVATLTLGAVL